MPKLLLRLVAGAICLKSASTLWPAIVGLCCCQRRQSEHRAVNWAKSRAIHRAFAWGGESAPGVDANYPITLLGSKLIAWWSPRDRDSVWQDTSGTVAVTADGQLIERIDDKSGNGHHMTRNGGAATVGYSVIDVGARSEFSDTSNTTYYLPDLVHITNAGRAVVAGMIKTALGL